MRVKGFMFVLYDFTSSMYSFIFIYIYNVQMYTHIYVYIYIYIYTHMFLAPKIGVPLNPPFRSGFLFQTIHLFWSTSIHGNLRMYQYICLYLYIYIYIYRYVYISLYIYIYIMRYHIPSP